LIEGVNDGHNGVRNGVYFPHKCVTKNDYMIIFIYNYPVSN